MSLLAECVNAMKKEDIKTYHSNLFNLFLEALDFRVHHDQEVSYVSSNVTKCVYIECLNEVESRKIS